MFNVGKRFLQLPAYLHVVLTLCVHTDSLPGEVGLVGPLGCGRVGQLISKETPVLSQVPAAATNMLNARY
jgi:hypothetical protein